MTTTATTRDRDETARATGRLSEAAAMLTQVAADMTALDRAGTDARAAADIARLAGEAASIAGSALVLATKELKLAQLDGAGDAMPVEPAPRFVVDGNSGQHFVKHVTLGDGRPVAWAYSHSLPVSYEDFRAAKGDADMLNRDARWLGPDTIEFHRALTAVAA